MKNDVFISHREAQRLYGFDRTTFEKPIYTDKEICRWCGKKCISDAFFCCKKCGRTYNLTLKWSTRNTNTYRENLLRRDNYTCQKCGTPHMMINEHGIKIPVSDGNLQVHHIVPRAKGGSDNPDNLITWCKKCHDSYHLEHNNRLHN